MKGLLISMHDCPQCSTPLHGYEDACPRCGAPQRVRKSYSNLFNSGSQKPGFNPWPFLLVLVFLGVGGFTLAQSSWIGQLMRRGPVQENPLDKMAPQEARQIIFQKVTEGLSSVGATGEFKWTTSDGEQGDMNAPGSVELAIDTKLPDPNVRRQIIDPIKELLHPAQVRSLVMNDSASHATWTYTVQAPKQKEEEPLFPLKKEERPQTATQYGGQQYQQQQQAAQTQQYQQQQAQQQQYQEPPPQQQQQYQEQEPVQQQQQPSSGSGSIDQIYLEEKTGDYSKYRNVN